MGTISHHHEGEAVTDSTDLGDRMKRYEATTRALLPRRTYTLLRVDGRSFHNYLRGCRRPFDEAFMADMDTVAEALCAEISGTVMAYTQSDEISILVTDFGSHSTEPWFGGVVAKQLSISASLATAVLNERRPGKRALFDARAFTISDPVEVANYFIWRQRDAVRNSISMAAQAVFSHKRLHGVSSGGMQELLFTEAGINWNDYPDGCKRGRIAVRQTGERAVEYVDRRTQETVRTTAMRSWWEASAAPHFTAIPGDWLARTIPALPTLSAAVPATLAA
jgi:tRNA(His) 5'-end guanylyltransferase